MSDIGVEVGYSMYCKVLLSAKFDGAITPKDHIDFGLKTHHKRFAECCDLKIISGIRGTGEQLTGSCVLEVIVDHTTYKSNIVRCFITDRVIMNAKALLKCLFILHISKTQNRLTQVNLIAVTKL